MIKLIVFMPIVFIAIGLFFGVVSVKRTLAFLFTFTGLGGTLLGVAIVHYDMPFPYGFLVFYVVMVLLVILGLWLAAAFGIVAKQTPAPIDEAVAAYNNLTDEEKNILRELSRKGLKVGAKHFAEYLHKKGHVSSAEVVREMTQ